MTTFSRQPGLPRVVLVGGARPNFMKLAPVARALQRHGGSIATSIVHTGQHYDDAMSAVFFEQLGLPEPEVCLSVGSGTHAVQTGRVMMAFEAHLLANPKPAGVVVVGDVNSTAACALTAVKLGVPVAHVEAGLRSFDRSMPEEINRIVTDAIADLLLVSEPSGEQNLRREGVPAERVRYVGNVMIDTLVHEMAAARALAMTERLGVAEKRFGMVTLHRPSNVDDARRLGAIVDFLSELSRQVPVLFPIHPRTSTRLDEFNLRSRFEQSAVRMLDPIGYREMLALMDASQFVITDSGGVQEETTYLDVPCITLRENTERPVTVTHGTNTVVGHDLGLASRVVDEVRAGRHTRGRPIAGWDGQAAMRVADALIEAWQ